MRQKKFTMGLVPFANTVELFSLIECGRCEIQIAKNGVESTAYCFGGSYEQYMLSMYG